MTRRNRGRSAVAERTDRPPARALRRPPGVGWLSAVVLGLVVVTVLLGPWLAPADPSRTATTPFAAPGGGQLLGADQLGRDVLSRVLTGGLPILLVPLLAVSVSTTVGTALGLLLAGGRHRGRRAVTALDVVLVLPSILVLLVVTYRLGPGLGTLVLVVTLVSAPFTARYVRSLAAPVLDTGYVEVAEAAGDSRPRVLLREVLPGLRGPLLADAGLRFVGAVYLVAAAGFLGVSPLAGTDDWASMLRDSLPGISLNPWAVIAPAVAIALVTVPANLLGDRLARGRQ